MVMPKVQYPVARRDDVVDDYHGTKVPDPYRWMEDQQDNSDLDAWLKAQDELCQPWLAALPGRDKWRATQARLLPGTVSAPAVRGDRYFFLRREPDQQHAVLLLREGDTERPIVDVNALDPTGLTTLDVIAPSPDGRRLVYGTSSGGDEDTAITVVDVDTGDVLDGPIDRTRYTDVAWLPDGTAFFYVRRITPEPFNRRVWFHVVGAPVADDELIFGEGRDPSTYYGVDLSRDGRWLAIDAAVGTEPRNDLYVVDLDGDRTPVTLAEGIDAQFWAHFHDGRTFVMTTLDAPRGRVAEVLDASTGPAGWRDVVAEHPEAVIDQVSLNDEGFVISRSTRAVSEVVVVPYDGGEERSIDLPGAGTAMVSTRYDGGTDAFVTYTDYVNPATVYAVDTSSGETSLWASPPGAAPPSSDVLARQYMYVSHDGTDVALFVIAKGDASMGPRPTILYGYGGFNISMSPAYSSMAQAWVDAGGVYAVACLRGGAEEGEAWHRAGMRDNKQNVFEDFIAAARYLKAEGWTTTEQLGIYGGSNGGLLVGATLTQWPTEMSAVICSAPLLDMLRYEKFGLGITWKDEYGRADDPVEFAWLYSYSPLHKVSQGTPYPSVLFTSFDNDSRTDVMHPRKMCAALQWATSSDPDGKPVLFRREADVGHSVRSKDKTLDLGADQLSYFAHQLGLAPPR
jgi:prolyl oligopeptidase